MSTRRRRNANADNDGSDDGEEESSNESVQSGSENSDAEDNAAKGKEEDDDAVPTYDEIIKLENENGNGNENSAEIAPQSSVEKKKKSARGPKSELPRKEDPAFVPRAERFFLHDDREAVQESRKGGGVAGGGSNGGRGNRGAGDRDRDNNT